MTVWKMWLKKKKRLLGNVTVCKFENIIVVRFGKYSCWEWKNKGRRKKVFFFKGRLKNNEKIIFK